eukprot:5706948-Lingulodinium_polyedra.AAC.1
MFVPRGAGWSTVGQSSAGQPAACRSAVACRGVARAILASISIVAEQVQLSAWRRPRSSCESASLFVAA